MYENLLARYLMMYVLLWAAASMNGPRPSSSAYDTRRGEKDTRTNTQTYMIGQRAPHAEKMGTGKCSHERYPKRRIVAVTVQALYGSSLD